MPIDYSTAKVAYPKLTLYAFHLRQNLANDSKPVKNANHLWEKCQKIGEKLGIPELENLSKSLPFQPSRQRKAFSLQGGEEAEEERRRRMRRELGMEEERKKDKEEEDEDSQLLEDQSEQDEGESFFCSEVVALGLKVNY